MEQYIATGDIIGSIVRKRLREQRYNQHMVETMSRLTVDIDYDGNPIVKSLCKLEMLFDYRWRCVIADALYVNDPAILNHDGARTSLFASIHEVFGDGVINWNRIALVCAIVGLLAGEALRIGFVSRVLHYVTWTEEYFRTKLIDAWIDRKSGWTDVCSFAVQRQKDVKRVYSPLCQPFSAKPKSRSTSPSRRLRKRSPRSRTASPCKKSAKSVGALLGKVADCVDNPTERRSARDVGTALQQVAKNIDEVANGKSELNKLAKNFKKPKQQGDLDLPFGSPKTPPFSGSLKKVLENLASLEQGNSEGLKLAKDLKTKNGLSNSDNPCKPDVTKNSSKRDDGDDDDILEQK